MVLVDNYHKTERVVLEVPSSEHKADEYVYHLTGYEEVCMCESWYSEEEIRERYILTDEMRDINDGAVMRK